MRRSAEGRRPDTATSLAKHELIGLRVEVVGSNHDRYRGLSGLVVDETRNTLRIESEGVERVVPKMGQRFAFTLPDGQSVVLEGARIQFNPEDRTKKSR